MAEQENKIIKIKGNLGGLVFYKLNGKDVVRKAYGPSKETINNNPAYKSTKNNNTEFAGATYLSKSVRKGLGAIGKQFQDTYMASRLTGLCRTIISNGIGEPGKREGNLLKNPKLFIGFPLIKNTPFNKSCTAKYTLQSSNNRNQITLSFPSINKTNLQQIPLAATHFKLTMAIALTSNYTYHTNTKQYLPLIIENNGIGKNATTALLAINQKHTNSSLTLTANNTINNQTAITVWLGITYFQKTPYETIPLKKGQVMQCVGMA